MSNTAFELAAVNGDARGRQQAKLSAKRDKPLSYDIAYWSQGR